MRNQRRTAALVTLLLLASYGCADPIAPQDFDDRVRARDMSTSIIVDLGPVVDAAMIETMPNPMPDAMPIPTDDPDSEVDMGLVPVEMDAERPAPVGDPACETFADCLAACADPDCARACRDSAPAESAALYDAIYRCGMENACVDPGGVLNEDCMAEACSEETLACYGPPPPPPPPPMGVMTCTELDDCLSECMAGDLECRDVCISESSQAGHDQLVSLQTCIADTECAAGDDACLIADCQAAIRACFGSVAVPEGASSCVDFNGCLVDCEDGDEVCFDACTRGASPEGYNQLQALLRCINGSECEAGDGDCQRAECPEAHEACFGPPPPDPVGDMDCSALNECLVACEDGDDVCSDLCIAGSSQESYDTFVAAIVCIRNSECEEGDGDCQRMNCAVEIDACLGAPPEPMGNLSCAEINQCFNVCPDGDRECINACIRQGSPIGWSLLQAAYECIEDAGCEPGDSACQQANCQIQIEACFNL